MNGRIAVLAFLACGACAALKKTNLGDNTVIQLREKGVYRLINPLLEADQNIEFRELRPFRKRLEDLVNERTSGPGRIRHIAVYFRDLNNGPWFGINEKSPFIPASLLKVPIMMAFFRKAEENPELLELEVVPQGDFSMYADQGLRPDEQVQPGKPYSIKELIRLMIVYSDNRAHDLLFNYLDREGFRHLFEELNLPAVDLRAKEIYARVKDYATFFRILYNASYLNRSMSERALELLSQSAFKEGLAAGLPAGIAIAHKFGERTFNDKSELQLHDCGIVYHPKAPYLICVMTRGDSRADLIAAIRDISALVYGSVNSQAASWR